MRKLQTFDVLHDHAQVPASLKGAVHGHHERVLGKREDVSLHERLLDLIPQNEILLVDLLHGEPLLCLLVPDQVHGSVESMFARLKPLSRGRLNASPEVRNVTAAFTRKHHC